MNGATLAKELSVGPGWSRLRCARIFVDYYNTARPHQSLDRNSPMPREVEAIGEVCATPVLGGLHHRYFRAA
jgi:hypothetical protein